MYARAKRKRWFGDSYLSLFPIDSGFTEPARSGWHRYLTYDPAATLARVRTPTLALYGGRDKKVDAKHDAPVLIAAFHKAGMRDLTVRWFPDAGHSMKVMTAEGFADAQPLRYAKGYPEVMIDWLKKRQLIDGLAQPQRQNH
jgi:pimeloyl-ACP methyl ester carboxylesterase